MIIGKEKNEYVGIKAYASVNAAKVTMVSNATWLTESKNGENSDDVKWYRFKAAENTGSEARTATVTVTFYDAIGATTQKTVTVTQAAANGGALTAVSKEYVLAAASEEIKLTLTSDRAISASASSNTSWLSASATAAGAANSYTISIKAGSANATAMPRVGYVSLSDGVDNVVVTVYQLVDSFIDFTLLNPDVTHITSSATDITYTAIGGNSGSVSSYGTSDCDWITIKTQEDNKRKSVKLVVSATENTTGAARTGTVQITVQEQSTYKVLLSKQVTIVQAAASQTVLEALVDNVTLAAAGETLSLSFIASKGFGTAKSSSSWLTVTPKSDESLIKLEAAANTSGAPRTAYVTVNKNDVTRVVTVYQPATTTSYAILNPDRAVVSDGDKIVLKAYGGKVTSILSSAAWIKPGSIVQSTDLLVTCNVTVAANTTGEVREGTVQVTWISDDGTVTTKEMKIVQSPTTNVLDVMESVLYFTAAAQSKELLIYASKDVLSVSAKAEKSTGDWCTASFNTDRFTVSVTKNEGSSKRNTKLVITAVYADGSKQTKTITVNQYGKD